MPKSDGIRTNIGIVLEIIKALVRELIKRGVEEGEVFQLSLLVHFWVSMHV